MNPNHKHFTCSHLYPTGGIDYTILLHLYAPNRATVKPFFVLKNFFIILSHDGNVLYGFCSFRTNISSYTKTLDQKRTQIFSGHAAETVFVQIPAENAPQVARALSSRIQERQNAFQIIWTWLLIRGALECSSWPKR